jgi:NAD(P)-dependent dehydrogenase (short-subunit alcohol dehydrogenase family)
VLTICADAGLPTDAGQRLALAKARFGRVDAAVHCAYPKSAGWGTHFEKISKQDLYADLTCQLGGTILFSQRVLEFFRTQGYGNLIHIASMMGVVTPRFENYKGTQMVSPIEYTSIKPSSTRPGLKRDEAARSTRSYADASLGEPQKSQHGAKVEQQ